MRTLTLELPKMVTARYLVPVPEPVGEPELDWLAEPLRELVIDMRERELLDERSDPAEATPPLPPVYGGDPSELHRAPWLASVGCTYLPGWPPLHEWSARAVALAHARTNSTQPVDFATFELIDPADAGLPTEEEPLQLTKWMKLDHYPENDTITVRTSGLSRFGLPELHCPGIPGAQLREWAVILNELALRCCETLFKLTRDAKTVEIPAEHEIHGARLSLQPASDDTLSVT